MILVLLGTQDKSFVRLLKEVDLVTQKEYPDESIIVQAGYTVYQPINPKMAVFDFVAPEELNHYIEKARVVITHAGVGSILNGMRKSKIMIVVPRRKKYGEHTNDHQLEILKAFAQMGYILPLYDLNKMSKILKKADSFTPRKYIGSNQKMVKIIEDFIK